MGKTTKTSDKASNKNINKLTTTSLNKLSSQFNEKKKIIITVNGEDFQISINVKFRESAIRKICAEYFEFVSNLQSIGELSDEEILGTTYVFNTLILREFTDLPIPKTKDIRKLIRISENLLDLGIVETLLGEGSPFGKENIELVNKIANEVGSGISKALSEAGVVSSLNEYEKNRIDVDDYFAQLELRNFEIAEDEDLSLLPRVFDQLEAEGRYEEYMSKFTTEELDKLNERMKLINERQSGDSLDQEV